MSEVKTNQLERDEQRGVVLGGDGGDGGGRSSAMLSINLASSSWSRGTSGGMRERDDVVTERTERRRANMIRTGVGKFARDT